MEEENKSQRPLSVEEENLRERLVNNINETNPDFVEQLQERENSLIVSVGSGAGLEFPVLNRLFPNARLIGIDIDPEAAIIGKEMSEVYGFDLEIRNKDAREESAYTDEEGEPLKADLILIRSPDPKSSKPETRWNRIVSQAAKHLKDNDGLLYSTVNHTHEQDYMQVIMERHLGQVDSNKDPLSYKSAGAFSERFVLIGSNKKEDD